MIQTLRICVKFCLYLIKIGEYMSYFINFLRVPKAGKSTDLLNAMKESITATGRPGNITLPVSSGNPAANRPALVSLIAGFKDIGEIDDLQNQFASNESAMRNLDAIDAMCDKTSYIVSEIVSDPITPSGEANIVSRTSMTAKPGNSLALLEAALKFQSDLGAENMVISRPISGPIGTIRMSVFSKNLQDLSEQMKEAPKHIGGMPDLVSSQPIRYIGRIVHRNKN